MEKYQCLVCHQEMEVHHKIKFVDHSCSQDDHHLSFRIMDHRMIKLRIRLSSGSERLVLKVHYDEGYSEVWSKSDQSIEDRIRVNQIIVPNFEDLDILRNKIKTALVFG